MATLVRWTRPTGRMSQLEQRRAVADCVTAHLDAAFAGGGAVRDAAMRAAHDAVLAEGFDEARYRPRGTDAAWVVNDHVYALCLLAEDAQHDDAPWTITADPSVFTLRVTLDAALASWVAEASDA